MIDDDDDDDLVSIYFILCCRTGGRSLEGVGIGLGLFTVVLGLVLTGSCVIYASLGKCCIVMVQVHRLSQY